MHGESLGNKEATKLLKEPFPRGRYRVRTAEEHGRIGGPPVFGGLLDGDRWTCVWIGLFVHGRCYWAVMFIVRGVVAR